MIKADDLQSLRTASPDYAETGTLKAEFRTRRLERTPFFLTGPELDRVFRWKLRGQYGRQSVKRARNSEGAYRAVTEAVFKAVGRALAEATRLNPRIAGILPSTKGAL